MKISMICFGITGEGTGRRLFEGWQSRGSQVWLYKKSAYLPDSVKESVKDWTRQQFDLADAIIFIGACGIAVRSIAPFVASKKTDPAVLVIDECGKFVISLLSGHLGGANELAAEAAEILGALPVITTATDLHHQFAVDVFAKKNGCAIMHMKAAKEVSAALLAGKKVGFYSEFPWEGDLPEGLVPCKEGSGPFEAFPVGVAVTIHKDLLPFASTVQVIPRAVTLGMGCRKGKEGACIRKMALSCLEAQNIYREALKAIASIDLKKDEPGLLALAEAWKVPFLTFSGEELKKAEGSFTPSSFVENTVGVDNVCERSAVLAGNQGELIQRKMAAEGVTAALALEKRRIHFE